MQIVYAKILIFSKVSGPKKNDLRKISCRVFSLFISVLFLHCVKKDALQIVYAKILIFSKVSGPKKNDLRNIFFLKQLIHAEFIAADPYNQFSFQPACRVFFFSIHFPRILPAIYA